MTGWVRSGLLTAIMTCGAGTLQADVVSLTDGSRIVGTLEQMDESEAKITGTLAGDLTVPRNAVATLETEHTVTVVLEGRHLRHRPPGVDENFDTAEDDHFFGSRWAINFEQRLWDGLSFFHYDEGLLGLEDTSDLTIRSRTGLRMDVTHHVVARVQTAIDWDKSPPPGTDSTDFEHTLSIGYTF